MESVVDALIPHAAHAFGGVADIQLGTFARRDRTRPYDVDAMVAAGVFSSRRADETPIAVRGVLPGEPEKPEWMRVRADLSTEGFRDLKKLMRGMELNTVCEEAQCPNIYECWESGTSTLMLLGDTCTRACAFCDVATGRPGTVDVDEPRRAAAAVEQMGLRHAVLTSVNRDDLPDGGAGVFAETIEEIRERLPDCEVEVLIPDFKGDLAALETVMAAKPAVLNHNTETVLRLQREIRTAANYARSLSLLARAKWINPVRRRQVGADRRDGRNRGRSARSARRSSGRRCRHRDDRPVPPADGSPSTDRSLRPSGRVPAIRRRGSTGSGCRHVEAGPLVRSSYHARDSLEAAR